MARVIVVLLTVGVTIYALVDCLRCNDDEVRTLPRQVWCLIALVPLVGGLAWLVYGRPRPDQPAANAPRMIAPDDDPDFLHALDQTFRERRRQAAEEARRRRRDEETRRREQAAEEERRRTEDDRHLPE
jgi:hypothetical protein